MKIIRKNLDLINSKKCIIFDFDGVIKDSVDVKTDAFAKLYKKESNQKLNMILDYHKKNGGISRFEKFKYFEEKLLKKKLSEIELNNLSEKFSKLVIKKVINAKPILGVEKFLKYLNSKNKILVVNSATPTEELEVIVKECKYKKYFRDVYGSPKSKKDNMKMILKKYELIPDQAIFFGDSINDYDCAISMGMPFCGIGNLFQDYISSNKIKFISMMDFSNFV